jgi:hypothetical protein
MGVFKNLFSGYKVFKMLLSKREIPQELVEIHSTWRHSGFNVFCGERIHPGDEKAMASSS